MNQLGIGIINTGKVSRTWLHWFLVNPNCKIIGIHNRTPENAQKYVQEYGMKLYNDWHDLIIIPEIDIIGLCGVSNLHKEQAVYAASHQKHIFCEKPMANTPQECGEMVAAARKNNVKLGVGYQMRFNPVIDTVHSIVHEIGKIFNIDMRFGLYRPGMNWRHTLEMGGGALKEMGSHLIDMLIYFLGDVESVYAENLSVFPGREVEDENLTLLRFKSGSVGCIHPGYNDHRDPHIHGNITGTDGQIEFIASSYSYQESKVILHKDGKSTNIPFFTPKDIDPTYPGHMDAYKKEIDDFVDCVINNREPAVTGEAGMKVTEVICAAYESQRKGIRIYLPFEYFDTNNLEKCFPKFYE